MSFTVKCSFAAAATILAVALFVTVAAAARCSPDSVQVGSACIDKYEASVWHIPPTNPGGGSNKTLIKRVQRGRVTEAQLLAGGAVQHGAGLPGYPCAENGAGCKDAIYAVSLPGVLPSKGVNWFRALAACGNSQKRLPTNAEWQLAALGTPDPGTDDGVADCNLNIVGTLVPVETGSRSNCVSDWGVHDMVGNLIEHVQDWVPLSQSCSGAPWSVPGFNDDLMCLFGIDTLSRFPGALVRGGRFEFSDGTSSGVYAVTGDIPPFGSVGHLGFRCAR